MSGLNKQDLQQMIEQLEKEFSMLLAKSEHKEEKKEEEKEEEMVHKEEKVEHEEKVEQEEKVEKEEEEKKEEEKKEEKEKDEPYTPEEIEELYRLYSALSDREREIHKEILEKCGEMKVVKSEQLKYEQILKSELKQEIEQLKKENAELKKSLNELVSRLLSAIQKNPPVRKTFSVLTKNEDSISGQDKTDIEKLSKSEIAEILKHKAASFTLSKSDREAINKYFITGQKDINLVKHLLK